ncbi:MAG TPA: hypothetical protein VGK38_04100 [Prolixibacteraceae bacterium]
MRFLITFLSILFYGLTAVCQDEVLSGLFFSSHEVIQEKRTSLNLTPSGASKYPNGFSLEMEANFRKGDGYYGYIFRIIGNKHTNIDLVSNLASTSSNFWLVLKDKVLVSYKWADVPDGHFDQWIKIRLDIDVRNSKLVVSFNGNKQEVVVPDISGLKNFDIVYGASRNDSFLSTDVCPMSLKNIRIFDAKNILVHDWKLSKHSQTKVYDEVNQSEALVENPNWSIDKHVKWRKLKDLKIENLQGITKDDENGRILLVDNRSVYSVSTESLATDTMRFAGGTPYLDRMGKQIIYNKYTNEIWSYNFNNDQISRFSFLTKKWSYDQSLTVEPGFAHHNRFISPLDSSLVTLMGYGYYTYKSIVNHYNLKLRRWEHTEHSNQIEPRYLSSAGFFDQQRMLVFGGYGSKTGRQELSPEFYYDLYSIDLNDYSFKKLWTLDPPAKPFVPCDALIADRQAGIFYTLVYNSGSYATFLHLAKFGIEKNKYQFYNDSIPYNFLDTESWSTLFLDKKTSQLIAITAHNSDVSVYAIAYPPLMPKDVYQSVPVKVKWYIWLIGVLLAGGFAFVLYVLFRKKQGGNYNDGVHEQVDHPNIAPIVPFERKTISMILFMGGFQIYDHKGLNSTASFSRTLMQLFLFIFLHTIKNGKGVSSAKLDEVLWYDKSGDSARNNRNVNISKLRSVLDEIRGMEVVNENSYWKINTEKSIFCDYTEILDLLRKSKSDTIVESEIQTLIALLSFGQFLPNIQTEWMDEFKSQFAGEAIDGLSRLFDHKDVKLNFSLKYHLAECIIVYDSLNDEAFAMKCSVLYHLGKKGMAKNLYDSFCREYKKVLGIDYAVSFNDTIK